MAFIRSAKEDAAIRREATRAYEAARPHPVSITEWALQCNCSEFPFTHDAHRDEKEAFEAMRKRRYDADSNMSEVQDSPQPDRRAKRVQGATRVGVLPGVRNKNSSHGTGVQKPVKWRSLRRKSE